MNKINMKLLNGDVLMSAAYVIREGRETWARAVEI